MPQKKIEIYVITHSPEDIVKIEEDEIYKPLFVGRNGKDNMGYLSDDSGDNISSKNPDYCELTGLYWMWKNSNADILGLCHYRRYFKNSNHKIRKEEIESYLKNYDIILPKKRELIKGTYFETYKDTYFIDVLNITRSVLEEKYPEYVKDYDKVMNGSNFSNYNMFIMNKELVDKYCNWIFHILFEVEKRIDTEKYPRVLGLVPEAIFNVWIEHNNLKVKELNVKYIGKALNIRMNLSDSKILRKLYSGFYFKFAKSSIGSKIENFIQNLFY